MQTAGECGRTWRAKPRRKKREARARRVQSTPPVSPRALTDSHTISTAQTAASVLLLWSVECAEYNGTALKTADGRRCSCGNQKWAAGKDVRHGCGKTNASLDARHSFNHIVHALCRPPLQGDVQHLGHGSRCARKGPVRQPSVMLSASRAASQTRGTELGATRDLGVDRQYRSSAQRAIPGRVPPAILLGQYLLPLQHAPHLAPRQVEELPCQPGPRQASQAAQPTQRPLHHSQHPSPPPVPREPSKLNGRLGVFPTA